MLANKRSDDNNEEQYTQKVLTQLLILGVVIIIIGLWQADFLLAVYAQNQLTQVGWFINGGILVLFLAGIYHLVREFRRLSAEEQSISQLLSNIRNNSDATGGTRPEALIVKRYNTLQDLHRQHSVINHSALAATLVALESSRISFVKFVHNVLILTGVFGTIVSLSIALLGASEIIVSATEIGSLGMIIHGMSTALSTTMTAIFAYLFYGYFYLRLMDAQTHVISRIEEATSTVLLPQFQIEPERAAEQLTHIVRTAAALVDRLDESQAGYAQVATELRGLLVSYRDEMQRNSEGLSEMTDVLREGFRLNEPHR
jgi:cell division protein FtsB